jgi:hypothetical protein
MFMSFVRAFVFVLSALLAIFSGNYAYAMSQDRQRTSPSESRQQEILHFSTMYAVDGPFLDSTAIRDVPGDYAPWIIAKYALGHLYSNGRLIIHVRGLVFPDAPNDEPSFRGLVSCLSEEVQPDKTVMVVTRNVTTDPFPTGPEGNANIDAKVDLPNPCIAPIVMILSGSEDVWFAVTGFEGPEQQ